MQRPLSKLRIKIVFFKIDNYITKKTKVFVELLQSAFIHQREIYNVCHETKMYLLPENLQWISTLRGPFPWLHLKSNLQCFRPPRFHLLLQAWSSVMTSYTVMTLKTRVRENLRLSLAAHRGVRVRNFPGPMANQEGPTVVGSIWARSL